MQTTQDIKSAFTAMHGHSVAILSVLLPISVGCLYCAPLSDLLLSMLMCTNFIVCIGLVWRESRYSVFFFFLLTYCCLFLGGRFWAYFLDPSLNIWEGITFYPLEIAPERRALVLSYVLLFMHMASIGYLMMCNNWGRTLPVHTDRPHFMQGRAFQIVLFSTLILVLLIQLYNHIMLLLLAMRTGSYLVLYNGEQASHVLLLFPSLFRGILTALIGIAWVYGDTKSRIMAMIAASVSALLLMLIGQRGPLGGLLLLVMWLWLRDKKIPLYQFSLGLGGCLLLVLLMSKIAVRDFSYAHSAPLISNIAKFLHENSMTLSVLDLSVLNADAFCWIDYLHFLPGISHYAQWFGFDVPDGLIGFNVRLCNILDSESLAKGYGMGWCIVSSMFLYGGKHAVGLCGCSLLMGLIAGWIHRALPANRVVEVWVIAIFAELMMSPRASLPINLGIYILAYFALFAALCWAVQRAYSLINNRNPK